MPMMMEWTGGLSIDRGARTRPIMTRSIRLFCPLQADGEQRWDPSSISLIPDENREDDDEEDPAMAPRANQMTMKTG